jgi:hypothetical protein
MKHENVSINEDELFERMREMKDETRTKNQIQYELMSEKEKLETAKIHKQTLNDIKGLFEIPLFQTEMCLASLRFFGYLYSEYLYEMLDVGKRYNVSPLESKENIKSAMNELRNQTVNQLYRFSYYDEDEMEELFYRTMSPSEAVVAVILEDSRLKIEELQKELELMSGEDHE